MDESNYRPIPTVPVPPMPNNDDEIDLVDLLLQQWIKRKFILKTTGIFLLVGLFVALLSPVEYTAQCKVVPQGKDVQGGNVGSLASIVGINIGTSIVSEGVISPVMYPTIIKSFPFTEVMMETPITVKKSEGKPITLYEYYTDKKYRTFNIVSTIKKYTIGLPGTIISLFKPARITTTPSLENGNHDSVSSLFVIT
ncbi:MAG: Wzz/FepE/Etk N-terminal domain-containing protein, partial [Dysgonamonadaceae bacterium]